MMVIPSSYSSRISLNSFQPSAVLYFDLQPFGTIKVHCELSKPLNVVPSARNSGGVVARHVMVLSNGQLRKTVPSIFANLDGRVSEARLLQPSNATDQM